MRARIAFSALAAVASLTVAARPAAAQRPTAAAAYSPRILAKYDFRTRDRSLEFPTVVAVTDSAGALVASAQMVGAPKALPMVVTVLESDLVLQGETPDGRLLTLVLDGQAVGSTEQRMTGRWTLGEKEGTLRGKIKN